LIFVLEIIFQDECFRPDFKQKNLKIPADLAL